MNKIAYIKQRDKVTEEDIEVSREVARVYKDRQCESSVYKEMLRDIKPGDVLLISTIRDIGSYSRIFALVRKLEKKGAYIQAKKEVWFSTTPESTSRELIIELADALKKR